MYYTIHFNNIVDNALFSVSKILVAICHETKEKNSIWLKIFLNILKEQDTIFFFSNVNLSFNVAGTV